MAKTELTTTARRRCPNGHLIQVIHVTHCHTCYLKKRWRERQEAGMTFYEARQVSKRNQQLITANTSARLRHRKRRMGLNYYEANNKDPIKTRKSMRAYSKKMVERYGGRPSDNSAARLRWLIDKEGIQIKNGR